MGKPAVVPLVTSLHSSFSEGEKPPQVQGHITFHDVHFAYPSRPEQKVAHGYNLTVEAGTTVALVGASGSGKSTAIQLIERFYDPDQGVVKLDGHDLKTLNVRWLRQQIGLVGQEPVLFAPLKDRYTMNERDPLQVWRLAKRTRQ